MRRSHSTILAWLLLTVISLNPLPGVIAIDMESASAMTDCQAVLAANAANGDSADHMTACGQHQACNAYCQFAPLQPANLSQPRIDQRPRLMFAGEPENLAAGYLEGIERPPRA